MSYEKPIITRFGSFREITRGGCNTPSDGKTFEGGTSVGNEPRITNGTTDYCFVGGSR